MAYTGVDSNLEHGEDKVKPPKQQKKLKSPYLGAKTTITVPRTLMNDFRAECEARNLSPHGILRDLMVCWVAANSEGKTLPEYKEQIQKEVSSLNEWAKEKRENDKKKLSAMDKRKRFFAKEEEKKKNQISEKDLAIHKKNPYDGWLLE